VSDLVSYLLCVCGYIVSTAHLHVYTHCLKTECFRSEKSLFLDSNISTSPPTYTGIVTKGKIHKCLGIG